MQELLKREQKKRIYLLHALPQKLNQSFPCVIVARPAYTEYTNCLTVMTSLDTSLLCNRDGHTKPCSWSQKRLVILRYQDRYTTKGSGSCFFCSLHLKFIFFRIISHLTQGPVFNLGNMDLLGPKYCFCTLSSFIDPFVLRLKQNKFLRHDCNLSVHI